MIRRSLLAGLVAAAALFYAAPAAALPIYAARAGRTCDNCHTDPTGWKNPPLPRRKCNLSCMGCHVNPTGGGLRTVSGRFYGQATLPALYASHRGYKDMERHALRIFGRLERERRNRLPDPALGRPLGGSASMAFDQGRYAGLNADPLLLLGVDLRLGGWIGADMRVFPMQLDVDASVHPVAHLSLVAVGGVLARSGGFAQTFERQTPFGLKDAFVMLHQLPMMSYLRAGRFVPPFGTSLDDHTSPIRRDFELDGGQQESRVLGVEVGLAPNYPYAHLAVFRPNQRDLHAPEQGEVPWTGVSGWGLAASFGWRDLGWQLGLSGMLRRRELVDGGDTSSLSLQWAFNPWYYLDWLPLTYMGEVAVGQRQRDLSATHTAQLAVYQELFWLLFNGVQLRFKYDYSERDLEVADDQFHRFGLALDLIVLPGAELSSQVRVQTRPGPNAQAQADGMVILRLWY